MEDTTDTLPTIRVLWLGHDSHAASAAAAAGRPQEMRVRYLADDRDPEMTALLVEARVVRVIEDVADGVLVRVTGAGVRDLSPAGAARAALRDLSARLAAVSVEHGGEFAAEVRLACLFAEAPLRAPLDLARALDFAREVSERVVAWTESMSPMVTAAAYAASDAARYEASVHVVRELARALPAEEDKVRALAVAAQLQDAQRTYEAAAARGPSAKEEREEQDYETLIVPAQLAACAAVEAMCALVDAAYPPHDLERGQ